MEQEIIPTVVLRVVRMVVFRVLFVMVSGTMKKLSVVIKTMQMELRRGTRTLKKEGYVRVICKEEILLELVIDIQLNFVMIIVMLRLKTKLVVRVVNVLQQFVQDYQQKIITMDFAPNV
jgi:hypothetical protein